jgi:hypothetical protein
MFSIYSRYFAYFAYSHKGELKFVKLVRKKIHDSATIPRNTLLYLIPLYIAAPASLSSRFLNNKVALVIRWNTTIISEVPLQPNCVERPHMR